MNLYSSLLFLHGHIADRSLAAALAAPNEPAPVPRAGDPQPAPRTRSTAMNDTFFFKSLLYLGGLQSIDSRIGEEEEAVGPTYGNRRASERAFGRRAPAHAFHRPVVPVAQRLAGEAGCALGCG